MKGLSEYLLTKFYLKKKKEMGETLGEEMKAKFKSTFDIISRLNEQQFALSNALTN